MALYSITYALGEYNHQKSVILAIEKIFSPIVTTFSIYLLNSDTGYNLFPVSTKNWRYIWPIIINMMTDYDGQLPESPSKLNTVHSSSLYGFEEWKFDYTVMPYLS